MRKLIGFWIVAVAITLFIVFGVESEQEAARRIQAHVREMEEDGKRWAQGMTASMEAQNEALSRFLKTGGITVLEFAEIQRKLDEKEKNECKCNK